MYDYPYPLKLNIAKSLVLLLLHNIRCSGQRILIISETTLKLYLNYSDIIKTLIPLFRPQNWETTVVSERASRVSVSLVKADSTARHND